MSLGIAPKQNSGFAAFISYAHSDSRLAHWVHQSLETYRLPRPLARELNRKRVGRVFLDRSELATSTNLSDRIEEALTHSANLIVICSPAARTSRWVNEEVRRFRGLGRGDRIFCVIVEGDPAREDDGGCFPPALFEAAAGETPPEPLAADIRPLKDRRADARLKLVAGLLNIPYDALRRREAARRQRLLVLVSGVSLALLAIMGVLTAFALISRATAVRERDSAERTSEFLLDVFNQADPSRATGGEPTLRGAIDEAAQRALRSAQLAAEPDVKASLLVVLANVYARLGRMQEAKRLVTLINKMAVSDPDVRMRTLSTDINIKLFESDYAGMRTSINAAFLLGKEQRNFDKYLPMLLTYRGQLEQAEGDNAAAMRNFLEARRVSLSQTPPDVEHALLALLAAGVSAVDDGHPERGVPLLRRVIVEREAMAQPLHAQVLTATNTLGAAEIKQGNAPEAERWFRKAEALKLRVYGEVSLDVAATRSNLGRALVEQRRFAEAAKALEQARAGYVAQVGDEVDTVAKLEDSLGLARAGLGQVAAARASFAHGLMVARKHNMPKEVDLLADRAELECRTGAPATGLPLLVEAREALVRFKLTEPFYKARLDAVEGGCLLAAGRAAQAKPLLASAMPIVTARWGKDSLFGRSVREDGRRAGLR